MDKAARCAGTVWVAVALALAVLVLGPFYWIFTSSLKISREIILREPTLVPHSFTLEHYVKLFASRDFVTYLANSFTVATMTAVLTVVVATLAGYSLYRLRFRGQRLLARLVLATYVFPATLLVVPIYRMMSQLKLVNTHWGLLVVNVMFAAPFSVWLLRGFFEAIPPDLEEAAALDGAGVLTTLFRVIFPLSLPGIATIAIYSFLVSWTEFLFASILIIDDGLKTLPLGLQAILAQYNVDWGTLNAAATITVLPALAFFAFVARYFIRGLTAGAIK